MSLLTRRVLIPSSINMEWAKMSLSTTKRQTGYSSPQQIPPSPAPPSVAATLPSPSLISRVRINPPLLSAMWQVRRLHLQMIQIPSTRKSSALRRSLSAMMVLQPLIPSPTLPSRRLTPPSVQITSTCSAMQRQIPLSEARVRLPCRAVPVRTP